MTSVWIWLESLLHFTNSQQIGHNFLPDVVAKKGCAPMLHPQSSMQKVSKDEEILLISIDNKLQSTYITPANCDDLMKCDTPTYIFDTEE